VGWVGSKIDRWVKGVEGKKRVGVVWDEEGKKKGGEGYRGDSWGRLHLVLGWGGGPSWGHQ